MSTLLRTSGVALLLLLLFVVIHAAMPLPSSDGSDQTPRDQLRRTLAGDVWIDIAVGEMSHGEGMIGPPQKNQPRLRRTWLACRVMDVQSTGQRAMDWAFFGDAQEPRTLGVGHRPRQFNPAMDRLDAGIGVVAMIAITAVIAIMFERDVDPLDRNIFARGHHAHGHRGACAQSREQHVIGRRPAIGASDRFGLVRAPGMAACDDIDGEAGPRAGYEDATVGGRACRFGMRQMPRGPGGDDLRDPFRVQRIG